MKYILFLVQPFPNVNCNG
uniref:Uncharacterized protein n=1 Tax=Arundo donax TaxID=35708 RepID=A0A0A9AUK6_ARUDO